MDESNAGPEVHVHRPEVPIEDAKPVEEKDEDEEEETEDSLEGSEAFLDLDTEGDVSGSTRHHHFLHRHAWVDATLKILSNPVAIVIFVLIVIGYCVYDMFSSPSSSSTRGGQPYTPPVPKQGSILEKKVNTPPRTKKEPRSPKKHTSPLDKDPEMQN